MRWLPGARRRHWRSEVQMDGKVGWKTAWGGKRSVAGKFINQLFIEEPAVRGNSL